MTERRELEGTGYHYIDSHDDCLLVSKWVKRPDDLTGQAISISKLLPRTVRCSYTNKSNNRFGEVTRVNIPVTEFKFRIVIEVEEIN
jgi:hypothetical protein